MLLETCILGWRTRMMKNNFDRSLPLLEPAKIFSVVYRHLTSCFTFLGVVHLLFLKELDISWKDFVWGFNNHFFHHYRIKCFKYFFNRYFFKYFLTVIFTNIFSNNCFVREFNENPFRRFEITTFKPHLQSSRHIKWEFYIKNIVFLFINEPSQIQRSLLIIITWTLSSFYLILFQYS